MFSDGGSTPPASTISACPRGPRCTKMHRGPFLFAGLQSLAVPVCPCLCHSSTLYLGVHLGVYLSIPKQVPPDVPQRYPREASMTQAGRFGGQAIAARQSLVYTLCPGRHVFHHMRERWLHVGQSTPHVKRDPPAKSDLTSAYLLLAARKRATRIRKTELCSQLVFV